MKKTDMETGLRELRCGECGKVKHKLFLRSNGEIIVECCNCGSQSEIVVKAPKIVIGNNYGSGTLCVFAEESKPVKKTKKANSPEKEVLKKRMQSIIVDKLGCEESEVTEDASFRDDLGADSLDAVELLMEFEKEFNVEIRDEDAETVVTFGDAVNLVYKLNNSKYKTDENSN